MKAGGADIPGTSRGWTVLLALLMAVALVRLWAMPLTSSFWVDEMGTAFVVQHGGSHPSLAVAPQVPQSLYYLLPKLAERVFGFSEVVYRVPSVLAMAAALFVISRLAARLIHPHATWFAAFACLALRGIDYQAADARPYGLGTLVACASVWFLVRWLDCNGWPDALGFIVLAALLWRVQLIFWPFYLIFGLYAAVRLARRDTAVSWIQAGVVFALLAAALAPVALSALTLYGHASAHVIASLPSVRELFLSFKAGLVVVACAGSWLIHLASRKSPTSQTSAKSSWILIVAWWLCQPLGLFIFSWLTGNSVFVARYLWLALPGVALTATLTASWFLPAQYWQWAALALGVGALLLNGQWRESPPWHHPSDWRGAAQKAEELRADPNTPVICPSPFVEARPPVWTPDYPLPGFLYAHLSVYPVHGRAYLFPFEESAPAEAYARQLTAQTLSGSKRFVLYGGQGQVDFWTDWFAKRVELSEWRHDRFRNFGDVEVVLFRSQTQ